MTSGRRQAQRRLRHARFASSHDSIRVALRNVQQAGMRIIPALIAASLTVVAQTPAGMVVTAEGAHDKAAPPVTAADVMVYQKDQRRQVLDWTPLKGDRGALEFYV